MMQDLEVIKKTKGFTFTVEFYGALFTQGEVMICMELMDISLYDYYRTSHEIGIGISADMLGTVK